MKYKTKLKMDIEAVNIMYPTKYKKITNYTFNEIIVQFTPI